MEEMKLWLSIDAIILCKEKYNIYYLSINI